MSDLVKGYAAAIASAVCYGMNPLGALSLYKLGFNADSALFYRFALASVMLGVVMLVQRDAFRLSRKELIYLSSLGGLFAISSLTYYDSFHHIDAGIASTLLFVYPIMVAVIMSVCFREKLSRPMLVSIVVALVGVGVLYNGTTARLSMLGIALVMISSLTYALYLVVVNRANLKCSAFKLTFYSSLFCSLVIFCHSLTSSETHLLLPDSLPAVGYIFILALFPGLLSLLLMAVAVRCIGSTKTAIFGALEPVTAVFIGVCVFGEVLTHRIILGILLILAAVTVIVVSSKKPRN